MSDVINLEKHKLSRGKVTAASVLRQVAAENPKHVFVIVWPSSGKLPTYHTTTTDMPVLLYRLMTFIHKYFRGDFERTTRKEPS
jgi:hypothetical protein